VVGGEGGVATAPARTEEGTATRKGRRPVRRLLLTLAAVVLAYFGLTTTLVTASMGRDERPKADAIVVLGAAQYQGRPSPIYLARLEHGLKLYRDGVAPLLVVTGGRGVKGERWTEGAAGRRWAEEHGVPADRILVEESSRNTYQNLIGVAGLLRPKGLDRVVLVSDPFHMFRAMAQAREVGLRPHPSPTRSSPISANPAKLAAAVLREDIAVGAWVVTGDGKDAGGGTSRGARTGRMAWP
jgi:uncharacterized SAM-binding protein YcdF (DUF218 family)